ncbi:MAG: HNH endonuclease [Candidatus Woesebacteria bacterium]
MANEKFDIALKRAVRERQQNLCGSCGTEVTQLLIHHILPIQMEGTKSGDNAVGLCVRCHFYWDTLAIEHGILFQNRM